MKYSNRIESIAKLLALCGGVVLLLVTVITCVSIIGRALIPVGLGPIPGDYELVQAGVGFSIFAFLPWCQITKSHASVDLLTNFFSKSVNRWINFVSEVLMAGAMIVIAWKLWDGTLAKHRYGDTTFILEFPVWWAYSASLFAAVAACLVAIYMVFERAYELATGKSQESLGAGGAQ